MFFDVFVKEKPSHLGRFGLVYIYLPVTFISIRVNRYF